MSDPVRRVVGTPVAVETNVLYEADRALDTNHDGLVDIREAGARWHAISEHGQQVEADRRFGYYGAAKDQSAATQTAVLVQQIGSQTGFVANGFALRGGARTLNTLAPYLRPGPFAAVGQALAEGADMYLQREKVTGPNLLRRAANVAYEGVAWTVAAGSGAVAGTAASPFVTPVGGVIVGAGTSIAVKAGLDKARDLVVESVARTFGY